MQVDAVDLAAVISRSDYVDDHRALVQEAQKGSSTPVGDEGFLAAGQRGSSKASLLADPAVAHGEGSTEDAVQSPISSRSIDCRVTHPKRSQLNS